MIAGLASKYKSYLPVVILVISDYISTGKIRLGIVARFTPTVLLKIP